MHFFLTLFLFIAEVVAQLDLLTPEPDEMDDYLSGESMSSCNFDDDLSTKLSELLDSIGLPRFAGINHLQV